MNFVDLRLVIYNNIIITPCDSDSSDIVCLSVCLCVTVSVCFLIEVYSAESVILLDLQFFDGDAKQANDLYEECDCTDTMRGVFKALVNGVR